MKEIGNWAGKISEMLSWISAGRIPYAEITLTVKGGRVVFIDYRGPLRMEEEHGTGQAEDPDEDCGQAA